MSDLQDVARLRDEVKEIDETEPVIEDEVDRISHGTPSLLLRQQD